MESKLHEKFLLIFKTLRGRGNAFENGSEAQK